MRPSKNLLTALGQFGGRLSLLSAAGFFMAATAWGQAVAPQMDARYALPTDAPVESAAGGEPLINWRREDAPAADAPMASNQAPTFTDAAPNGSEDANPLRRPLEPPPQFAQVTTTPAVEPVVQAPTTPALEPLSASPGALPPSAELPAAAPPFAPPVFQHDPALAPAMHDVEAIDKVQEFDAGATRLTENDQLSRRLAPPSSEAASEEANATSSSKSSPLPFDFSKLESLSTAGVGLAVVVGLFLVCMWMLRRGGPKPGGALPTDAFAVLGRAPLSPQTFAHLLRVGNKLVLVAMTPGGVQPLTEVTDPMEVDRLTGLCASGRGHGPSAEFQQVLAQLSREPARGFLGAEATAGGSRRR